MESYKTEEIMVSVDMITFNHEKFISQAIEGVLMQKTNFRYELVIGEDCSSDNTSNIVKEYAKKHPEIIKARCNTFNLGMAANGLKTGQECSGKYIAICEGDDYWTDPYKLQKQVDFLEANQEYALCFHDVILIDESDVIIKNGYNSANQKCVSAIADLALNNFISTPSCVFRNNLIQNFPEWVNEAPFLDYIIHMLNAKKGKIKYFKDKMACYRIHSMGLWQGKEPLVKLKMLDKTIGYLLQEDFDDEVKRNFRIQITRKLLEFVDEHSANIDNSIIAGLLTINNIAVDELFIRHIELTRSFVKIRNNKIINLMLKIKKIFK